MLTKFSFTLLIISFVLISCAKKDDGSKATATTYATSKSGVTASGTITMGNYEMSGTYATLCADASPLSTKPTNTTYFGFALVVTGSSSFTRELNYYTDSACTTLSAGWWFNNDNVTDQGPTESDSTANEKVSFNQINQQLFANTTEGKTFFDTLFGSGMDVTVGTAFVATSGITFYNLIKMVSDTNLYYGNPSGTDYPSTSPEAEYVKQ